MFLKGETLLSLGRIDDAISVFTQILEYNTDNFAGRVHNSIGFCYSLKNEINKANSEFKKAIKYCDEQSLLINSAILNLAAYYPMSNQKENTFKIFKELYKLDPSNGHNDVHISFLTLASTPEELIQIYNHSIDESYNADISVLFAKGYALVNLERFDEAISVFDEILKYSYNKEVLAKAHNAIGVCYSRNDLVKAGYEFEKACDYSNEPAILYNLAINYTQTNRKEKALEIFKELSLLDPINKDIKKNIEMLELELNKKDSIKDTPFDSIEDALAEADSCLIWENYDEAIKIYDLITDVMPEHSIAWNHKGSAYNELGRYEEAIECFNEALKYDPNFFNVWYNKAFVSDKLNRLDDAIECYEKALELSPDNPKILENMALIYTKKGDFDKALKILKNE